MDVSPRDCPCGDRQVCWRDLARFDEIDRDEMWTWARGIAHVGTGRCVDEIWRDSTRSIEMKGGREPAGLPLWGRAGVFEPDTHNLRWIKQWICSERPITICSIVKTWLCQGSRIWPTLHYRRTCAPTCAERDFWAIRHSHHVQVDWLVSYPLVVFIYLRSP